MSESTIQRIFKAHFALRQRSTKTVFEAPAGSEAFEAFEPGSLWRAVACNLARSPFNGFDIQQQAGNNPFRAAAAGCIMMKRRLLCVNAGRDLLATNFALQSTAPPVAWSVFVIRDGSTS